MKAMPHHEGMFGYILLTFILVIGPLAVLRGVDSRVDDVARRRRFGR